MKKSRRNFIENSTIGIFGLVSIPASLNWDTSTKSLQDEKKLSEYYPSTDPESIRAVVGAAHANFDKVKELVNARPELAKATWDWGFGDVETALGAASHMGRKDIAEFLIGHGARPDIYAFTMLGKLNAVKAMIKDMPGIQKIGGPHGFTLMHHAKIRLLRKMVEGEERVQQERMVDYLETIGDANTKPTSLDISEEEQKVYLGKYIFGKGETDYFEVKLNMRKMLSIGRGTDFGRAMLKVDNHTFSPGGAPSVRIKFELKNNVATSVTIHDSMPIVKAIRVEE